jgi:hypothetical protein
MLEFLNKVDDIAVFITGPTPIPLPARIDIKRGAMVIVKRTNSLENGTGRAQGYVTTDDIDDVVGFFNLLFQGYPIVRQWPLRGRNKRR